MGGATALLSGTPLNEEQRELVALLEAGTSHVVLIIEDILLHGALVSGAFRVARERLELARVVLDPAWRMVRRRMCNAHSAPTKLTIATLTMRHAGCRVAGDVPALAARQAVRAAHDALRGSGRADRNHGRQHALNPGHDQHPIQRGADLRLQAVTACER